MVEKDTRLGNQHPSPKYSVYKVENGINCKCYVGITSRTIEDRFNEHLSRAKNDHRNSRLYAAIRKYGSENFSVTLLETSNSEDAVRKLEERYIRKLDTYENGYNCNYGGCGHLHIPDWLRKKMGDAQRGKIIPLAQRLALSEVRRGDTRWVKNFGDYTLKGKKNPKARAFLIKHPNGNLDKIVGLRAFCREHNLNFPKFTNKGRLRGYEILERFTDYPEREYTQASGNGIDPNGVKI